VTAGRRRAASAASGGTSGRHVREKARESTLILFPLTFVSSAFAPPDTMPGPLRAFVLVNPVTKLVEAVRGLVDGAPGAGDAAAVLAISAVMTIVFAPLALWRYARRT